MGTQKLKLFRLCMFNANISCKLNAFKCTYKMYYIRIKHSTVNHAYFTGIDPTSVTDVCKCDMLGLYSVTALQNLVQTTGRE